MLKSILVHLDAVSNECSAIRMGVDLAQSAKARLCGLSLADTRRVQDLSTCESAAHLVYEQQKQQRVEKQLREMRSVLSSACLAANLNFDVRRMEGNPLEILPSVAKFHDLLITTLNQGGDTFGLAPREIVNLAMRGVQPILVLRSARASIRRVLLVFEGSEASGRAIRSYLSQALFPEAEVRLLGIGSTPEVARASMREMVDYCRAHGVTAETGYLAGPARKVLVPYAHKWQADLVVQGVTKPTSPMDYFLGIAAMRVLRKSSCSLYLSG